MIFSNKKEEERTPFTVEKCYSCNKKIKRKFSKNDYIFKESSECSSCKQKMIIDKIFGETITEQ